LGLKNFELEKSNNIVIFSDGSPWIKDIKNYLFPDAYLILDFNLIKNHLLTISEKLLSCESLNAKLEINNIIDRCLSSEITDILN
jgi:hypothetical protein